MSYDMELRTGFFKTCRCSVDLNQECMKFHQKKTSDEADVVIPLNSIYEVSFLRVNDKQVELIVNSSDRAYVGRISDTRQAIAMANQMRDEYGLKVHLE